MAQKFLLFYLNSGLYFNELSDFSDKWNCIIEIFLKTLQIHGKGGHYNLVKLLKIIRSQMQTENRHQMATSLRKMRLWDDDIEIIQSNENQDAFAVESIYGFLQSTLCPNDWKIIESRYVFNESTHAFAEKHNMKYEAAKRKLTRAKHKALKLLIEKFPDEFTCFTKAP